jgi:hypothetical protein
MSEQEFELYLKLLAKCLRLTSGQREEIADELRDHLEERLEELAKAGLPRDKAVVQALDEFGDAAVLAAHFTTIARLKRRRFLMRLSLGSVGVLTAGLLIAFAFWPENRAVRGPDQVVAQEKPKAAVSEPSKRPTTGPTAQRNTANGPMSDNEQVLQLKQECKTLQSRIDRFQEINRGLKDRVDHPEKEITSLREQVKTLQAELDRLSAEAKARPLSSDVFQGSKVEARIAEALIQPVDFEMQPESLQHAIEFIAARYQIPIVIDRKALQDANVDLEKTNVALLATGIPMRDMLDLLLDQANLPLAYEVRHGVLTVSTIDKIQQHWEIVVYDCRDLVDVGAPDRSAAVAQAQAANGGMFQFGPETMMKPSGAKGTPSASGPPSAASMKPSPKGADVNTSESQRQTNPLIRTLTAATGPEAWSDESQATISEFGGLLVVRQNPLIHQQIRRALADIRQMRSHGAYAALANPSNAESTHSGERPQKGVPTPERTKVPAPSPVPQTR